MWRLVLSGLDHERDVGGSYGVVAAPSPDERMDKLLSACPYRTVGLVHRIVDPATGVRIPVGVLQ